MCGSIPTPTTKKNLKKGIDKLKSLSIPLFFEKLFRCITSKFFEFRVLTLKVGYGIIMVSRGNANCGANVAPDRRSSTNNNRAKKIAI